MSSEDSFEPRGLYVHVPFCVSRCSYCSFVTWTNRGEQEDAYFRALCAEVGRRAAGSTFDTVYFGGGTPSLPEPARLAEALAAARRMGGLSSDAEVTLEANPESVDARRAEAWREAGFNRVSVGVQSFTPSVLETLGRAHGPDDAERAVAALRAAGFADVSVDLMAGLPGEDDAGFAASLERALAMEPEHLSLYALELDEDGRSSPLSAAVRARKVVVPDAEAVVDRLERARERLHRAGLPPYEISNFARTGHECRHNLKYWRCEPTLGAGVGAWWLDGGHRRFNVSGFEAYLEAARTGGDAEDARSRSSTPVDLAQEKVWLGLRLSRGIDLGRLENSHPGVRSRFRDVLDRHVSGGLLAGHGDAYRLTPRGVFVSDLVFRDVLAA